ncbi:MAG: type IV secretion protein Dot, partial [Legionellales bacterium]
MPKSLAARIKESLDVSGAFDNCFFHTYASYLLANEKSLPDDLFTFKSLLGDASYAAKLQTRFPNQESLSLFEDFARPQGQALEPVDPNFLVEKTLVLGFLLRE